MASKKPQSLKIISGTDQPCRRDDGAQLFVEEPLTEAPPPPDWLPNAHAMREWNRLAPILAVNKLLTESSMQSLGVLCACYGKIVQLYAAGESPNASQLAQYRGMAAEFGLTPLSQSRLKPNAEPEKENRFSKHGKRPDA
jgi:phage terminase small subunit